MGEPLPAEPSSGPPSDWQSALEPPDAALPRALDLCGLDREAAAAFLPLFGRQRTNPAAAYTLALLLTRGGDPGGGRAIIGRTFGPVMDQYGAAPGWLRVVYPTPYSGRVEALARQDGVDPALVYGVIKQESDFDETAVSPVGARGLMQLMPYTAGRLAGEMGRPAPTEAGPAQPAHQSGDGNPLPRRTGRGPSRQRERRRATTPGKTSWADGSPPSGPWRRSSSWP